MASSATFSVGTSAVQIATGLKSVAVQNLGDYVIFLGGSGVSESNGLKLVPSQNPIPINLGLVSLETLYAISESSAGSNHSDVRVLSFLG